MATQGLHISISGGTVSQVDWRTAMDAEARELPELNEAQKEAARRIGMEESEYARGVLASTLGERREQARGRTLAAILEQIAERAGGDWKLQSLVRKGADSVWMARFENAVGVSEIAVPLEVADDAIDSDRRFEKTQLENLIVVKLGQAAVRKAS